VNDQASYTVKDARGYRAIDTVRTASSTLRITVSAETNQTLNVVGMSTLPDGNKRVSFAGIPGQAYAVQATDSLTPPVTWTTLSGSGTNAPANGLWAFSDLDATNHVTRFYRTIVP
jgi:hypothetical protein